MKISIWIALATFALLSGCATEKVMEATGGSRADDKELWQTSEIPELVSGAGCLPSSDMDPILVSFFFC